MAGWPVKIGTPITQEFGQYPNPDYQPDGHTGMDFAVPVGTPVYAVADGVVRHSDWAAALGWPNDYYIAIDFDGPANGDQSAGIVVVIDHGNFVSISAHLNDSYFNPGDTVKQGDTIGRSGTTGRSSGPHLHFEVLPDGWNVHARWYGRINPRNYITEINGVQAPKSLQANERLAGPDGGNQRSEAKTSAPVVRVIAGGTIEKFDGFVRGQSVTVGSTTSDIWFKDNQGFVWSGVFESQSTAGLADLTPVVIIPASTPTSLKANQRLVGHTGGFQRVDPSTGSKAIRTIEGGSVETFTGFVHGESVTIGSTTSDVWFKDAQGYVWAGVFDDQSTAGLPDVTPSKAPVTALKPNQRKVNGGDVNQRLEPNTASALVRVIKANTVETFTGFVQGQSVTVGDTTTDIWFKDSQGYAWAGGFTPSTAEGLPPSQGSTPVTTPPSQGSTPVTTPPSQGSTPGSTLWKADLSCVDEVVPAHPDNYQEGNFPTKPKKVVTHQFGNIGIRQTSVSTYFAMGLDARRISAPNVGPSSAHFSVSNEGKIMQHVQLKNRAYHAGSGGNDFVGIEIDPEQSEACIQAVIKLMRELNAYYGYELTPVLHKDVPGNSTSCGTLIKVDRYSNVGFPPASTVKPVTKAEIMEALKILSNLLERM